MGVCIDREFEGAGPVILCALNSGAVGFRWNQSAVRRLEKVLRTHRTPNWTPSACIHRFRKTGGIADKVRQGPPAGKDMRILLLKRSVMDAFEGPATGIAAIKRSSWVHGVSNIVAWRQQQ